MVISMYGSNKWRKDNHEQALISGRKSDKNRYDETKKEIFELLGNHCNNPSCPIPVEKMDVLCLQIDHVLNNGGEHRRKFGGVCNVHYYASILKEIKAGSRDYDLLCPYCNWLKRFNGGKL